MKRLPMRKISEALRLKATGLSTRKNAASLNVGQSTVSEYLGLAARVGLSWSLPQGLDEATLERRLFAPGRPLSGYTALPGGRAAWITLITMRQRLAAITLREYTQVSG